MLPIQLRIQNGIDQPEDLTVQVREATFEYLMSSTAKEIRVSTYLDRNFPKVEATYSELYINEECPFESKINTIIPGSRTRSKITLPGPMQEGEQLIVIITRKPRPLLK